MTLYQRLLASLGVSFFVAVSSARTFTVVNSCPFTIWPAMFTDLNVGTAVPNFPTGWEAPPTNSVSFTVPDNWTAGRIWGRRDCNFTITSGPTCLDGWCNGGLLCDPHTGTGVPPVTVAEWTLQGDGNRDFYDVSLVDGFNLPMEITFNPGINCSSAGCPVDLVANCPAPLQGPLDSNGSVVGCKSACFANLDGNPNDSSNCCTGSHNVAATCPSSGVQYYDYFKGNCPDSYAYAYDESSGTALWTCNSSISADYTLTFCPPSGSSSGTTSGSAAAVSDTTGSTGSTGTTAVSGVGTSSASAQEATAITTPARPNNGASQGPVIPLMMFLIGVGAMAAVEF